MPEIVDAGMQHPTLRHSNHAMFESLRRWTRTPVRDAELPLEETIAAMDAGGVSLALTSAWYAPHGDMISNDEVAGFVARYPDLRHPRSTQVDELS